MTIDENTRKRLQAFAEIGKYLYLISDENYEDDEYFNVREALNTFSDEIFKLELTPTMKEGIDYFIKYIDTKINKRKIRRNL